MNVSLQSKSKTGCGGDCEDYDDTESPVEQRKEDLEDELELEIIKRKLKELKLSKGNYGDFTNI